jgi:hypothetical protein
VERKCDLFGGSLFEVFDEVWDIIIIRVLFGGWGIGWGGSSV